MKRNCRTYLFVGAMLIILFILWTIAVSLWDVQPIGPRGSRVGFATINRYLHHLFGVHMTMYVVTDWLSLIPVAFAFGFAILGLVQWIKRKHILKVDEDILILGVFYLVVMAVYLLFESRVINYRPVLINGYLEASYPSSTTILVLCILPTTVMQLQSRIKRQTPTRIAIVAIIAFTGFMLVGRWVSGVHWFTDIVGGALISVGLVYLYKGCCLAAKART